MAYKQINNPFPVTSCGRRRTFTQGGNPGDDRQKTSRFKKSGSPIYKKEVFEPHMMYKGGDAIKAETYKEHLRLKKESYGHTKPKKK